MTNNILSEESPLFSPLTSKFKSKMKSKYAPIGPDSDVSTTDGSAESSTNILNVPETPKKRIPALGIMLAMGSVFCYSMGSALVNLLPELHSIEILVVRAIFQFVYFGGVVLICKYPIGPKEKGDYKYLALRCISGTITLTTVFVAYRLMPLADASTIQFASPVFVAIFAYFMLKEALTIVQFIAGAITLAGVVVISQPEFIFGPQSDVIYDQRMLGTILAVVSSVSGALSMIGLRKLKTTPVAVIVMWFAGLVIVVGLIILLVLGELVLPVGWYTWGILTGVGVCGVGDQYLVSKAMQYEGAGPVSVTRTFTIVMTFVWEAVLLGQAIEWLSIIGASLITFCVLLLALDKWRKESPEMFENMCKCCNVSDEFYDNEEHKTHISDSFNTFYDSIENNDHKNRNNIYYNQFILIEESTDGHKNVDNIDIKNENSNNNV